MSQAAPTQIAREKLRDLREREDENEIEEQLERFDGAVSRFGFVDTRDRYLGGFAQQRIAVESSPHAPTETLAPVMMPKGAAIVLPLVARSRGSLEAGEMLHRRLDAESRAGRHLEPAGLRSGIERLLLVPTSSYS